jgi:DNA-binding transcriptional ArsR family regulator
MPDRMVASRALAELLGVLAHPHRVRILEELREGELDVSSLQQILQISHSGVSQHLAVLRAHRLVMEHREGRRVFYRLRMPGLARWLVDGMEFLGETAEDLAVHRAIDEVRQLWSETPVEDSVGMADRDEKELEFVRKQGKP